MRYPFLFFLIFSVISTFANEKHALKLLEKQDFDKLIQYLEKSIDKDSINPGAYYVYSLLYNDSSFNAQNLDTAYYYILISQEMIRGIGEKDLQKLNKAGITDSVILGQKQKLDHLGYLRAKRRHTISDYNEYIQDFSTSTFVNEAIQDRNALAYELTEKENTYQAYHFFMQQYPESRQYFKAEENYDRLLFEDQIRGGTLKKYEDFINKYPDSPFLPRAMTEIYNLMTSLNSESSLVQFIRKYPKSVWVTDAIDRLYHNYLSRGNTDFTNNYNYLPLSDSIKYVDQYVEAVLIPVLEKNKYGFITSEGKTIIHYLYDDIELSYLCGNIKDDFLIVIEDDRKVLISRTGDLIYADPFYDVEDIGYGLLKIGNQVNYGLIFKTGKKVLPVEFGEIIRLDDQFIKVRQNAGWRLYSVNGILIMNEYFQEINKEGEFLLLKNQGKWAVTTNNDISISFINGSITLDFKYDDYELVEPTQILCFWNERETVLDKNLIEKIPLDNQRIITLPDGWLVRKDSLYHIYDDAFVKISGSGFDKIEYKGKWISGKSENKWILYFNYMPFPDVFAYDSINILSDQYVLGSDGDSTYLIFSNLRRRELRDFESIQILKYNLKSNDVNSHSEFLKVELSRNGKSVFNREGREIISGDYDNIQALGPEYLIIQKKGKVGLTDTTGRILLKPQYDAIANYTDGFVSVLNQKKFGLYNLHLNLFVIPRYDRLIKAYNQNYLIVHDRDGFGLIDMNRADVTNRDFEEIVFWNDTSMLAKRGGLWQIHDLINNQKLLDNIIDFEYLKDQDEKIIIYSIEDHYGVASNRDGIIINHTFNDIINLGSENNPVFFAEKYVPEAEFYIVIYYDRSGGIMRKQVFDETEYDKIYCN